MILIPRPEHKPEHPRGNWNPRRAEDPRHDGTLATLADVAQLVEQLPCKQQVIGSSPIVSFRDSRPRIPFG